MQVSWNFDASQAIEPQPVYRVRFRFGNVWAHADTESANDTIDVEIFQEWLKESSPHNEHSHDHHHEHDHAHDHSHSHAEDHGHTHETKLETERVAIEREIPFSLGVEQEAIAECLLKQVVEAGIVSAQELLEMEALRDARTNDPVGPKVVAKAWVNDEFRKALVQDGTKAIKEEFGVDANCKLVVFENTLDTRNLIVCTLCSCYPTAILGRPPAWYKSRSFRARAVFEPRKVIRELGGKIPDGVRVAVHDSTADLRYFIIPERPASAVGITDEVVLAKLVDRDSMIGLK